MAKPPKAFHQPIHGPASNKVIGDASLLPSNAPSTVSEPSVPKWVTEILLSEVLKRGGKGRAFHVAQELLGATELALSMEKRLRNTPIGHHLQPKENFLAEFVRAFFKSPRRTHVHPVHVIQMQANLLLNLLQPYSAYRHYGARSLWIADHFAEILKQLAQIHGCASGCVMRTNRPTDKRWQEWAQSRGLGMLRTKFLAYYHGVHEDTIRRLWK